MISKRREQPREDLDSPWISAWKHFPACNTKKSGLAEFKRQKSKHEEDEAAGICGTEYERQGSHAERQGESSRKLTTGPLSLLLINKLHMYRVNLHDTRQLETIGELWDEQFPVLTQGKETFMF